MTTGKKTPGGAGTHTRHTEHADAQRHTDHTDEPHNHRNPPTTHTPHVTRQRDDRSRGRLKTQQPQARSRPLPAADSEEAYRYMHIIGMRCAACPSLLPGLRKRTIHTVVLGL